MSCLLLKVLGRMCVRSFGIFQILYIFPKIYPRLLESVAGGLTSGDSCHFTLLSSRRPCLSQKNMFCVDDLMDCNTFLSIDVLQIAAAEAKVFIQSRWSG